MRGEIQGEGAEKLTGQKRDIWRCCLEAKDAVTPRRVAMQQRTMDTAGQSGAHLATVDWTARNLGT